MATEYRKFLEEEIKKADEAWKKALQEGNFLEAETHGKRAAQIEAILIYHLNH